MNIQLLKFKKLSLFLFQSNIFLAVIAVIGAESTARYLDIEQSPASNPFIFLAVIAVYLFDKLNPSLSKNDADALPDRLLFLKEFRPVLIAIMITSAIIAVFVFTRLPIQSILLLIFIAIVTSLYLLAQDTLVRLSFDLPFFSATKPFILGTVWALVTVVSVSDREHFKGVVLWLLFFIRMQSYLANAILFDFRDRISDRRSQKLNYFLHVGDIKIQFSLAMLAAYFLFAIFCFVGFIFFLKQSLFLFLELIPLLIYAVYFFIQSKETVPILKNELQYLIWVDGALLAPIIVILIY